MIRPRHRAVTVKLIARARTRFRAHQGKRVATTAYVQLAYRRVTARRGFLRGLLIVSRSCLENCKTRLHTASGTLDAQLQTHSLRLLVDQIRILIKLRNIFSHYIRAARADFRCHALRGTRAEADAPRD